jgi:BirA family transcriptional regulator, biotin operon repressor / biotin---[acetyl-CoA-carboxylase] ligase
LLAGVATAEAIASAAGGAAGGLRLKWPNDVLIGQSKCAGILAESIAESGSIAAVVGIGINLASHPHDLGRAATHLAEHGVQIAPDAMLVHLDGAMQRWLDVWDGGANFARVREAWLQRAGPIGEPCTANTGTEKISGAFLGLDDGGALMLRDDEGRHRIVTFGDVTLGAVAAGGLG